MEEVIIVFSQPVVRLALGLLLLIGGYFAWPFIVMSTIIVGLLIGFNVQLNIVAIVAIGLTLFSLSFVRRYVFTLPIFTIMKALQFLPTISKTEKEAIEAGSTWVDKDLFSGSPNFNTLMAEDYGSLTADEQAYLDGPVNELCEKVIDWDVYQQRDFSDDVWTCIKKNRFFGLIIPKEYGGLGFSATANSLL